MMLSSSDPAQSLVLLRTNWPLWAYRHVALHPLFMWHRLNQPPDSIGSPASDQAGKPPSSRRARYPFEARSVIAFPDSTQNGPWQ